MPNGTTISQSNSESATRPVRTTGVSHSATPRVLFEVPRSGASVEHFCANGAPEGAIRRALGGNKRKAKQLNNSGNAEKK